jgi:L,D-peptidoglycan transpeptidase YkuD (ErfK/YbiS/YcfS/YnhG family)
MIFRVGAGGWLEIPTHGGRGPRRMRCALGPAGVCAGEDKREGDGATPAGLWPMRRVLFRPDQGPLPKTALATAPIAPDDGWCDAPQDPAYNRPVKLPYPARAERMWREDRLYDLVIPLGYNDDPPVPRLGSAIFLHVARPDFSPTEGCVALARTDLEEILSLAEAESAIEVLAP